MPSSRSNGEGSSALRALVTGGANGIGAAVCARLAGDGVRVVVADVDERSAAEVAARLAADCLVIDLRDVRRVQSEVSRRGPFDILVNCAGVDQHAFFTNTDVDEWSMLIEINLVSVLATTHAVLPAMREAGYGRIVNVASEAGRLGSRGGAVYAAAKGGVIAFTRSIARENARNGITANAVAPGPIDTSMTRRAIARGGDRLGDAMTSATLMNRLGSVDEVAAAVCFLASAEASYITGETLGVSGGMGCGQ